MSWKPPERALALLKKRPGRGSSFARDTTRLLYVVVRYDAVVSRTVITNGRFRAQRENSGPPQLLSHSPAVHGVPNNAICHNDMCHNDRTTIES